MSAAAPVTPADLGDLVGFVAAAVLVVTAVVIGFVALLHMQESTTPGDRFSDDFIPDRSTVAATERALPKMPRQK